MWCFVGVRPRRVGKPSPMASATPDGQVIRWDTTTGARDPLVNAHDSYVFAVAMSRDGRTFVTGGSARDKTIAIRLRDKVLEARLQALLNIFGCVVGG